MAGIRDTQQRQRLAQAEKNFPGNGRITAMPYGLNATSAVETIREGEGSFSSIPWMLPQNRRKLSRDYASFRENRFDPSNPEDMARYRDVLKKSASDENLSKEVAAYRTFVIQNDVLATPWALSAFQSINLSAGDLPLIERPRSRNLQRFTVRSVGIDGGALRDQWRTTKSAETLELELLTTDRVEYPIMDIQQGDIGASQDVDRELRYDLEMKLDTLAKANIDAAKVVSGLRDVLSIHPNVDVNNIPDTNYLNLNGVDTAGELSIGKLKTILDHVSQFGAAGGADEGISISTIMLSPQNLRDPWDFIDLVSGFSGGDAVEPKDTVPTPVRENIFQTGMITNAWGHTFSWMPNAQLSKGKMYVMTSKPLGWFFGKSELDRTLEWNATNSPDHAENNVGEILHQKAVRFYVPDVWQHRIVIVDL